MSKRKKKKYQMTHYLVAFIDILGQQDKLRNLKSLPDQDNPAETEEFYTIISDTYGSVKTMQETFKDFFHSFHKKQIDTSSLTGAERKFFQQLDSNPIKFQNFSDCTTIYMSLQDNDKKMPTRGIYGVLGSIAVTFLKCLALGFPIRGGIDIGLGMEINKNEFYGPALSRAYALESKIAQYPRIVIGDELINYLRLNSSIKKLDQISGARKIGADMCLNLFAQDSDGYPIIDYLGEQFHPKLDGDLYEKIITKAYESIIINSAELQKEKRTKEAFKYSLLKNYFEHRRPQLISTEKKPPTPFGARGFS